MRRTRIKICCISSVGEARLAVRHGADALGLVSSMPSGPGVIAEDLIAEIAAQVPPGVATFLLTSHTDADAIIEQQRLCGVNAIQLCDAVEVNVYGRLRRALPGISLVQVIHVDGPESVRAARSIAEFVDAILLDSGRPNEAVKELGGTGRTHDWRHSRAIIEQAGVPVYLAGGINAGNVGQAIRDTSPFGVDLCTGVRSDGHLDEAKLRTFVGAVAKVAA
jgi:phosphoribosylanthranilate isomerase